MGIIRREEVLSHPFAAAEDFSSDGGSSSPESEFDISSRDSDSFSSSNTGSFDSAGSACVVHHVSRFDTLAGLAIKYGVEIADIKRANNLVSDLQMFAHRSLLIPLPGCHTLSPLHYSSINSKNRKLPPKESTKKHNSGSVYSPKTKCPPHRTSSAMSSLQSYYGLLPQKSNPSSKEQCTEMALFGEAAFTAGSRTYSRRPKKSDTDLPYDCTPVPEIKESKRCFSEDSLTHPLLVNGIDFVRKSASASGLRLRF